MYTSVSAHQLDCGHYHYEISYLFRHNSLVAQVPRHGLDQLNLLLWAQARNRSLENRSDIDLVEGNEGVVVHVRKESHDELAVHAVSDAAMSWNRIAEVLNLEAALQPRSEEASKWSNQRRKCRQRERVKLHRGKRQ